MTWRFVAADFDQMHQNHNIDLILAHPDAELVGVCDEQPETSTGSLEDVIAKHALSEDIIFETLDACLKNTDPDVIVGCPNNAKHPAFVERVASTDAHVILEKPLAMDLDGADRMIAAMADSAGELLVSWPTMADPAMHTVKSLIDDGIIGDIIETQFYGGNAGAPPLDSWFYDASAGGGSLLDYLCYGATFTTWFRGGELPESVSTQTYIPADLDVDVQSATVANYPDGLGTYQTSWRMFTHPWEHEPQPNKGYTIVGTDGTISTQNRNAPIVVQTAEHPDGTTVEPEPIEDRFGDIIAYVIDMLERDGTPTGPPAASFSREAQRLIEAARQSSMTDSVVELPE